MPFSTTVARHHVSSCMPQLATSYSGALATDTVEHMLLLGCMRRENACTEKESSAVECAITACLFKLLQTMQEPWK
jgi:hypothetical protein